MARRETSTPSQRTRESASPRGAVKAAPKKRPAPARASRSLTGPRAEAVHAAGHVRGVALLRGVNVGGNNKLPMSALRAICQQVGCTDVSTYIQSGNAIFTAPAAAWATLQDALKARIHAELGLDVPVVVRTAAALAAVAAAHPLDAPGVDPAKLFVMFLRDTPTAAACATLDPTRSPPDRFVVLGQEIFLSCPNGGGKSKLTAPYFDARLRTISTARNWNTVRQLHALCGA